MAKQIAKVKGTPRDSRIDAKIAAAPAFARPVMTKLRAWVHKHCPQAEEALKWNHPSFLLDGKILCSMAAFKAHCTFGFWNPLMRGDAEGSVMSQCGRMTGIADLPAEAVFAKQMKKAIEIETRGLKPPAKARVAKAPVTVPDDLAKALGLNAKAKASFDALSPSHRREYIEWITDAKRPETRERRLTTTLDQLADAKPLHWKYQAK